jgi:type VI secretion system protein ImpH
MNLAVIAQSGLLRRLYERPYEFDFFQLVRLVGLAMPESEVTGHAGKPGDEIIRFRASTASGFAASDVQQWKNPDPNAVAELIVHFMGLQGPRGVLPNHYNDCLRDGSLSKESVRSLCDWFDIFNHRCISLHYRAWERYRFGVFFERETKHGRREQTRCLFPDALGALLGIGGAPERGVRPLRNRLQIRTQTDDQPLASLPDQAFFYFAGFFAKVNRSAEDLEAVLCEIFGLNISVVSFHGQWLKLEPEDQSRIGLGLSNNRLGVNTIAGEKVWDVQSKIRIRIGPLDRKTFDQLMPDERPLQDKKSLFLIMHMVRMFIGLELDYDVQLVLRAKDMEPCCLANNSQSPARLGWNTWALTAAPVYDADDVVLEGREPTIL